MSLTQTISRTLLAISLAASIHVAFAQSEGATKTKPVVNQLATLTAIDCSNFEQMVLAYQQKFQSKMLDWSAQNLANASYQTAFYPFSGPDVVTVMSLYPKASYYVMVADQIPEYGSIERPEKMAETSKQFECRMLARFARSGFYLTNDLNGKNGPRPRFIKLLIYNIAFSGSKILDVKALKITQDGLILPIEKDEAQPRGVRFSLETKDGRKVLLDYLQADLSDSGLEKNPELTTAFARKGSQVVLIKSASHLLQKPYFSKMSEVLLQNAQWVTQDETGLSIGPLSETFNLELYGKFIAPNRIWAQNPASKELAKYFSKNKSKEDLPFVLGYEKVGGSVLMVGQRKR